MIKRLKYSASLLILLLSISVIPLNEAKAENETLPSPQLVTDAWMLIIGYEADREVLKEFLPEGLEPHENNRVVLNMYTVPDGSQTSGFGSYTLTYVTIEVKGHDGYTVGQPVGYPGRYWTHYFNSSETMRKFTKDKGIPVSEGFTTTKVEDGKLIAKLKVDGKTFIESRSDVGSEFTGVLGGHFNYFGYMKDTEQIVKFPIPIIGKPVKTENTVVEFKMPKDHSLYRLKPNKIDWAVWIKGSFVYPQYLALD